MASSFHRFQRTIFCTLVFGLVALSLVLPLNTSAQEFHGRVVGVADGDTIIVLRDRHPYKVRLSGIDAPERAQAFGQRARQFAAELAFNQEVAVHVTGRDRFGRMVGDVFLADGRSLNRELVRAGYAWWFRRYSTDSTLGELETRARTARAGLWVDPHPVAPWEWRKTHRGGYKTLQSAPPQQEHRSKTIN